MFGITVKHMQHNTITICMRLLLICKKDRKRHFQSSQIDVIKQVHPLYVLPNKNNALKIALRAASPPKPRFKSRYEYNRAKSWQ